MVSNIDFVFYASKKNWFPNLVVSLFVVLCFIFTFYLKMFPRNSKHRLKKKLINYVKRKLI